MSEEDDGRGWVGCLMVGVALVALAVVAVLR